MDYRDAEGYLHEDVLRVLGRSAIAPNGAAALEQIAPAYGRLRSGNFDDSEPPKSSLSSGSSSTSSTSSSADTFSVTSFDADAEWEDAKRVLYLAFVGTLLPMAFRYIGRRAMFSVWTQFLVSYFKR
ncbi:hypothetical protein LPJ61_000758 [Coemansia biformis]|uniref:Uncharacterized protein n=1 Tax=Coemansia biformis TaxID=1286918 RepID=A0A9W8D1B4_9FUNG|nr:hypothetical protein LPJ61_000758 [Coemansia biformis]